MGMDNVIAMGSRLRNRYVKAGSAAYDSGNTSTIKLPKGFNWRALVLRLLGSMNISVAGTVKAEAPLGLISKVELLADGGNTIIAAAGRDAFRDSQFLSGKLGELVAPTGTGAAVAISAEIMLPLEALGRISPSDSLLYSEPYAELELKITWAALSAIYTGGTASINATTRVDVYLDDTTEVDPNSRLIRKVGYLEKTVTAATTEFDFALPKVGLLDHLLIRADVDDTPNDALISSVRFQFDNSFEPIKSVGWVDLQNKSVRENRVDGGAAGTQRIAGYAIIDLIENGMLSSAPNLKAMIDPKLIFDVTLPSGTTRLIRVTYAYYEVRPDLVAA